MSLFLNMSYKIMHKIMNVWKFVWRFPILWGAPSHHPFVFWNFHEINQAAFGVPPFMESHNWRYPLNLRLPLHIHYIPIHFIHYIHYIDYIPHIPYTHYIHYLKLYPLHPLYPISIYFWYPFTTCGSPSGDPPGDGDGLVTKDGLPVPERRGMPRFPRFLLVLKNPAVIKHKVVPPQ